MKLVFLVPVGVRLTAVFQTLIVCRFPVQVDVLRAKWERGRSTVPHDEKH